MFVAPRHEQVAQHVLNSVSQLDGCAQSLACLFFSCPLNVVQKHNLMMQLWLTVQHRSSKIWGVCGRVLSR